MTTRALDLLGQELAETEPLVSRKPSFSQRHPRLSLVVIVDRAFEKSNLGSDVTGSSFAATRASVGSPPMRAGGVLKMKDGRSFNGRVNATSLGSFFS